MNDEELRAEQELIDDVLRLASAVEDGLMRGQTSSVWQERRRQIAALRQRIGSLRDQHLGRRTRVQRTPD